MQKEILQCKELPSPSSSVVYLCVCVYWQECVWEGLVGGRRDLDLQKRTRNLKTHCGKHLKQFYMYVSEKTT